jgi:hypothetical protein
MKIKIIIAAFSFLGISTVNVSAIAGENPPSIEVQGGPVYFHVPVSGGAPKPLWGIPAGAKIIFHSDILKWASSNLINFGDCMLGLNSSALSPAQTISGPITLTITGLRPYVHPTGGFTNGTLLIDATADRPILGNISNGLGMNAPLSCSFNVNSLDITKQMFMDKLTQIPGATVIFPSSAN